MGMRKEISKLACAYSKTTKLDWIYTVGTQPRIWRSANCSAPKSYNYKLFIVKRTYGM